MLLNKDIEHFIGYLVDGTYSHDEEGKIIYGSNNYPSHRIQINEKKVDEVLENYAEFLRENSSAD